MPHPGIALLAFALGVLILALFLWPGWGVVARLRRGARASERVAMEDALKHLYKFERVGREPSIESVAGALEVSRARAAHILDDLREARLVDPGPPGALTEEGRSYALRVIRTHRLWERFLADRTGIGPGEWHARAEEQEHYLTEEAVERLDARLGRPRFDPHGDPIPTATGEIPAPEGVPLTKLGAGEQGRITHLEDEPAALYDRLVAEGLSPGMHLRVLAHPARTVEVEVDGRTLHLPAPAAANVTVVRRLPEADDDWSGLTLADLGTGESGEVVGLSPACQGVQRRRLLDLGVVPGTRITSELAATAGDPTAYRIRGALVALRRPQQRWIRLRRVAPEEVA